MTRPIFICAMEKSAGTDSEELRDRTRGSGFADGTDSLQDSGIATQGVAFQNYLDKKFSSLKRELREDLFVSNVNQLKKFKDSSRSRDFKWASNRKQFEFNSELKDDLDSIASLIRNGEQYLSLDKITETGNKLSKRNKLIKLADRSPAGWDTVAEYESDDLASDSDDDKKIRRAEGRALAKKKQRAKPSASQASFSGGFRPNDVFRPMEGFEESTYPRRGNPYRPPLRSFRRPVNQLTQCYACGGYGHYRSECPRTSRFPASYQGAVSHPVQTRGYPGAPIQPVRAGQVSAADAQRILETDSKPIL